MPTAAELQAFRDRSAAAPAAPPAAKDAARGAAGDAAAARGGTRTHRIKKGDTLEGLARELFGKQCHARLKDIKQLNPGVDPTRLRVGQLILLPVD
jgi:nucleoid-associated protein YgaU